MRRRPRPHRPRGGAALITGGAGFIGTNIAARLLEAGRPVRLFDNLSRAGVDANLRWLRDT
jgi:CDP-paratose 2-epimerase